MKRWITAFLFCLAALPAPAMAQTVEDGWQAIDVGDYEKAKSILLPLAESGDARAMNAVGLMHDNGNGFTKNPTTACDWYEKSALSGYASAQNNLSICYENGEGRPKDISSAIHWMELAARQGDIADQVSVVRLTSDIDIDKAKFWGQKAVDQNSAYARVAMWGYDIPHTGLHASNTDILCVFIMNGFFGKPTDYCDFKH